MRTNSLRTIATDNGDEDDDRLGSEYQLTHSLVFPEETCHARAPKFRLGPGPSLIVGSDGIGVKVANALP